LQHDSINIKQKGDTIYKDSYHTIIKYKEQIKNDSINNKQYYNITKTITIRKRKLIKLMNYYRDIRKKKLQQLNEIN